MSSKGGSGKTALILRVAADLGMPVWRINRFWTKWKLCLCIMSVRLSYGCSDQCGAWAQRARWNWAGLERGMGGSKRSCRRGGLDFAVGGGGLSWRWRCSQEGGRATSNTSRGVQEQGRSPPCRNHRRSRAFTCSSSAAWAIKFRGKCNRNVPQIISFLYDRFFIKYPYTCFTLVSLINNRSHKYLYLAADTYVAAF